MFERGVRGSHPAPGSGLGLTLVRRACERQAWTVTYCPVPGGGNVFQVRFC